MSFVVFTGYSFFCVEINRQKGGIKLIRIHIHFNDGHVVSCSKDYFSNGDMDFLDLLKYHHENKTPFTIGDTVNKTFADIVSVEIKF